jgi:Rrf2 family protein
MEMTMAGGYGLLGVMDLATSQGRGPRVLSDVAQSRDIPESYLRKIFNSMARAGLLRSVRGARGGFTLARDPADITVREVIETAEGGIALKRCLRDPPQCEKIEECPLFAMWAEAQEQLVQVFDRWTVADLLELERKLGGNGRQVSSCPPPLQEERARLPVEKS